MEVVRSGPPACTTSVPSDGSHSPICLLPHGVHTHYSRTGIRQRGDMRDMGCPCLHSLIEESPEFGEGVDKESAIQMSAIMGLGSVITVPFCPLLAHSVLPLSHSTSCMGLPALWTYAASLTQSRKALSASVADVHCWSFFSPVHPCALPEIYPGSDCFSLASGAKSKPSQEALKEAPQSDQIQGETDHKTEG